MRQVSQDKRRLLETDEMLSSNIAKEDIHMFKVKAEEADPSYEFVSYFLKNDGVGYVFAAPHNANELDITTRVMHPQEADEQKIREGLNYMCGLVGEHVYMKTAIGSSKDAFFIFNMPGGAEKQMLVKVNRPAERRFTYTIITLTKFGSAPSDVPTECDEDPQPGCPMEELS
jgi:hypothetical protein